jgi:NADH-quinone oxidoreductase subunit E
MNQDFSKIPELIDRYPRSSESVIMILQEIQREYHYLPPEGIKRTAEALALPLTKVYSIASFYKSLSLKPKGENVIRVCEGTACHIRGAKLIREQIETKLGIKAGETTPDGKFSIEVVACVGACAMAPVVMVNDKYHGSVKVSSAKKLVKVK